MNSKKLGWMIAILTTVAFSTTPPIGRAAIQSGIDPTALLVGRYLLATLFLGVTLRLTDRSQLGMDRKGFVYAGIAGAINGIATLAYFWALDQMSVSITAMLFSLYPLMVLVILAFRGEKFTLRSAVRCFLGVVGVYLILGPGGSMSRAGILLTLLAAVSFAIYLVILQWYLPDYPATAVSFYAMISMTGLVIAFWFVQGASWQSPGMTGWLSILVLAFIGTFLTRLGMFYAVQNIGSAQFALFAPLETLLAIVWSLLFLGEKLTFYQWLGGGLILLSATLAVHNLRWLHIKILRRSNVTAKNG